MRTKFDIIFLFITGVCNCCCIPLINYDPYLPPLQHTCSSQMYKLSHKVLQNLLIFHCVVP